MPNSSTAVFSGADGTHWRDLIDRGLFDGIKIHPRWPEDPINGDTHIVAVPIRETRRLTDDILAHNERTPIISLSGIMSIMPDVPNVARLHFLFWPWASEWLRAVHGKNPRGQSDIEMIVLRNAHARNIRVIEMSPAEHDGTMAIAQWLSHLLVLALSLSAAGKTTLFQNAVLAPWKKTPTDTIVDMISRNPWVPEVWGHFMTSINRSRGIRVAFHDTLNKQVAPELATPNTRRVAAFLDHHENLTDIGQLPFIGECIHDTHALAEVVSSIKSQAVFSVSEK